MVAVPHDLIAPGQGRTVVETVTRVTVTAEGAEVEFDSGRRATVPAGGAVPLDDDRVSDEVKRRVAERERASVPPPPPRPDDRGPTR